jgi:hypothetical protein
MQTRPFLAVLGLAACFPDLAEFPPVCDPEIQTCPPGAGSTGGTTAGDDANPSDPIATVTGATGTSEATSAGSGSDGESDASTGEPAVPAIESVVLAPDPLKFAGAIEVDVLAAEAEGVRLTYPGVLVELTPDKDGHFRGQIVHDSGLSNGTHEATLVPWTGELEGEPVVRTYDVELPAPGTDFLWDPMPDYGLGQFEVMRVSEGRVFALGTIYKDGSPRCVVHRRDLEGKYGAGDVQILLADQECLAIDLAVDGETLHLLVSMKAGNEPRWRYGTMTWGEDPSFLRTGLKDEVAHALARSASGTIRICGAGPTAELTDLIDGRVWPVVGLPLELDYVLSPNDPQPDTHLFDETLRDCEFVGESERLIAVGDVFGKHEPELQPNPPKRARPLIVELDGEPAWHVAGLGPGNTTQGAITALSIDGQGRYGAGLYTCGDACGDPQGEARIYEPGGKLAWQVTLGAGVLPPQDVAWSPAGYLVVATAEQTGNWSSKFLLQAFIPGQLEPAWTFSRAEAADPHLARAVAVGSGAVIGGGVAGSGFPTLVFLRP